MTNGSSEERQVDEFILAKIDTVPHLEALLLLWNSRPKQWSAEDLSKRLYINRDFARNLLLDLSRERIIVPVTESAELFYYDNQSHDTDRLIELVDATYRHQVVRVSTLIHSKGSSAVRDFARAFRFTKERG